MDGNQTREPYYSRRDFVKTAAAGFGALALALAGCGTKNSDSPAEIRWNEVQNLDWDEIPGEEIRVGDEYIWKVVEFKPSRFTPVWGGGLLINQESADKYHKATNALEECESVLVVKRKALVEGSTWEDVSLPPSENIHDLNNRLGEQSQALMAKFLPENTTREAYIANILVPYAKSLAFNNSITVDQKFGEIMKYFDRNKILGNFEKDIMDILNTTREIPPNTDLDLLLKIVQASMSPFNQQQHEGLREVANNSGIRGAIFVPKLNPEVQNSIGKFKELFFEIPKKPSVWKITYVNNWGETVTSMAVSYDDDNRANVRLECTPINLQGRVCQEIAGNRMNFRKVPNFSLMDKNNISGTIGGIEEIIGLEQLDPSDVRYFIQPNNFVGKSKADLVFGVVFRFEENPFDDTVLILKDDFWTKVSPTESRINRPLGSHLCDITELIENAQEEDIRYISKFGLTAHQLMMRATIMTTMHTITARNYSMGFFTPLSENLARIYAEWIISTADTSNLVPDEVFFVASKDIGDIDNSEQAIPVYELNGYMEEGVTLLSQTVDENSVVPSANPVAHFFPGDCVLVKKGDNTIIKDRNGKYYFIVGVSPTAKGVNIRKTTVNGAYGIPLNEALKRLVSLEQSNVIKDTLEAVIITLMLGAWMAMPLIAPMLPLKLANATFSTLLGIFSGAWKMIVQNPNEIPEKLA